jgi:hypothetical protein
MWLKYVLNCEENFSYFYLDYLTSRLTVTGLARAYCIYKNKGAHIIHDETGSGAPFILDMAGSLFVATLATLLIPAQPFTSTAVCMLIYLLYQMEMGKVAINDL